MSGNQCIVVNYDLLEQSATSLRSIGEEFENTGRTKDDLVGHLGSGDIADAMGDFSGNWDRKREALIQKIKATEGVVRSFMATFSEQDRSSAQFDVSQLPVPMPMIQSRGVPAVIMPDIQNRGVPAMPMPTILPMTNTGEI